MQPFLSCLAAEEAGGAGVGREGRLAAGDALGNALAAREMAQEEAKRMAALAGEREGSQFIAERGGGAFRSRSQPPVHAKAIAHQRLGGVPFRFQS